MLAWFFFPDWIFAINFHHIGYVIPEEIIYNFIFVFLHLFSENKIDEFKVADE